MSDVSTFVADLRALADFYQLHPTLPIPLISPINAFVDERKELAEALCTIGQCQKQGNGEWFYIRKWVSPSLVLDINIRREKVCTARVVGTKIVPAQAERVEDVVEWDCGPVLAEPADLGLVVLPVEVAT